MIFFAITVWSTSLADLSIKYAKNNNNENDGQDQDSSKELEVEDKMELETAASNNYYHQTLQKPFSNGLRRGIQLFQLTKSPSPFVFLIDFCILGFRLWWYFTKTVWIFFS